MMGQDDMLRDFDADQSGLVTTAEETATMTETNLATQLAFDDGELCTEDRQFVREAADEINHRWVQTTENVVAIGKRLTEVKARLTHGQFGRWLAAEFKWSDRHARNFMSVYEWAGHRKPISDLAIQLEPTAVYQLAAPSTPEPARQEVLAKVEQGERPTTKQVKATIAKHKPTRRSAKPKPIDGDREPTPPKTPKVDPIVAMRQLETALRESKVTPSDWATEQPAFRRRVLLSEIDALRSALTRLADALRGQLGLDQPEPTLAPTEPAPQELCEELADDAQPNGEDLGARIRAHRKAKVISLQAFATSVGCTAGMVSNIQQGRRQPSAVLRERIEAALKTAVQ